LFFLAGTSSCISLALIGVAGTNGFIFFIYSNAVAA
jgi:hypothetical protein